MDSSLCLRGREKARSLISSTDGLCIASNVQALSDKLVTDVEKSWVWFLWPQLNILGELLNHFILCFLSFN